MLSAPLRAFAVIFVPLVSLVTFVIPPSAIVLGMIVLGERLELHHVIGMAIIMAGLIVIDGRLLNR